MVDELLTAPRRGLGALARAVWRVPDRLLHGTRRRAAEQLILARPHPRLLLVVCYGNICRSPFAARRLNQLIAPLGTVVESAGLVGPGRPAPAEGIEAARRFKVELAAHRARLLTAARARMADLIIVMEARQAAAIRSLYNPPCTILPLGDFDPVATEARAIADPVNQPVEVFLQCYTRIERCVRQLAATLRRAAKPRAK